MAEDPLAVACMRRDVQAARKICDLPGSQMDQHDPTNGQTPLMVAATLGDMEIVWLLLDAKADPNLRDNSGRSALDLARARDQHDVVGLLGGDVQGHTYAGPAIPDFSSEDDEEPPPETGHLLVLDHKVSLSGADLTSFQWSRYENGLAKLAGVDPEDVFVTPEPGRGALELHATVVKRLKAAEAWTGAGIDEVMGTVKSLQRRQPLQQASGGQGTLSGTVTVKLFGEAHDAVEAVSACVGALKLTRDQYEEHRDAFMLATETQGRGFSAAKAIMLLKEERNAIKAAAEKAAALSEQRKKRHGGGRSGRGEI